MPADEMDDRDQESPVEITDEWDGDEWARRYDELDGQPEGEWDR
jgi:hypothetical protein